MNGKENSLSLIALVSYWKQLGKLQIDYKQHTISGYEEFWQPTRVQLSQEAVANLQKNNSKFQFSNLNSIAHLSSLAD